MPDDLTGRPCLMCGELNVVWLTAELRPGKWRGIPVQATEAALEAKRGGQPFNPRTMQAHYDLCRHPPFWYNPKRRKAANQED